MPLKYSLFFCAALLALVPAAMPAGAQEDVTKVPVYARQHKGFTPLGLRLGRLTLAPSLQVEEQYFDNLYLTDKNTVSDRATVTTPSVSGHVDLSRHSLDFSAKADIARYADKTRENYEDLELTAGGNFEILRDLKLRIDGTHAQMHEARQDATTIDEAESPATYALNRMRGKLTYKPNRLALSLIGQVTERSFDDNRILATGVPLIQSDRDSVAYKTGVEVGYDISPSLTPFIGVSRTRTVYDNRTYVPGSGFTGAIKDNDAYGAEAGINFNYHDLVLGTFAAGYGFTKPDQAGVEEAKTATARANVTWLMTPLTTVDFHLNRDIDLGADITGGLVATEAGIKLSHELRRNLILGFGVGQKWRSFEGSPRQDATASGSLDLDYKLGPRLSVGGSLIHSRREGEGGSEDYKSNAIMFRVKGQF